MQNKVNKLVVLGAGWLGHALCVNAQQAGWKVQGTRRSNTREFDFERQFKLEGNQLIHQVDLDNAFWSVLFHHEVVIARVITQKHLLQPWRCLKS